MSQSSVLGCPRVVVIGAGMSGLLMGHRLQQAGIEDFVLLEKADEVGGTWRENRYPGLACDVPSHLYSYSFAPNPEWTRRFSYGPEIQRYFERFADTHGLRERIRFGAEVIETAWQADHWRLQTADGRGFEADFVIAACGVLHHPFVPDIPGLASFAGQAFHTARWPDGLDLTDKRVGIVGTGSTSAQLTPRVAEAAGHLTVFQRTAQWIYPVSNRAYTDEQRERLRRYPSVARSMRFLYGKAFDVFNYALRGNEFILSRVARACRWNLDQVSDLELRRKLTPDYEAGCKRLILSGDFYAAVERENVSVVTEPIERITAGSIRTADGTDHPLDVLVLATGFRAHDYMRPMKVLGCDGITLDELWREGARAYRTVALPGFPNLFMLIGPHSPIGNFSLIDIAERQSSYVMGWIERWRREGPRAMMPTAEATRRYDDELVRSFEGTIWLSGCHSWYLDEHGVPSTWPHTYAAFKRQMRKPRLEEFESA